MAEAGSLLDFDLAGLIAAGPQALLDDTYNQQPAILATSVAILRAARDEGLLGSPALVAGHSLGEFSALVAAEALDFPGALALVRERGRLMRAAGELGEGRMVAVLGLDDDAVVQVVSTIPGAQVANFNAPGQVVVSGAAAAVDRAAAALAAAGAKRLVPLPITIAAHSELMAPAAAAFAEAVAATSFRDARVPVVVNRTARAEVAAAALAEAVAAQLCEPVRWTQTIQAMLAAGVRRFVELGPGGVLSGLTRRIVREQGLQDETTIRSLEEPPG
jgi:[acyl-carrier-protein] S-malonyltransferase